MVRFDYRTRLGDKMNLSKYKVSELEERRKEYIFTEDEEMVYGMLLKGKSRIQIADKMNVSVPTVDRRIRNIRAKLNIE